MEFTPHALEQQKIVKEKYPELEKFYQDEMGNFSFSRNSVIVHMSSILKWMKEFPDYHLLNQCHDEMDEEYYLTDLYE